MTTGELAIALKRRLAELSRGARRAVLADLTPDDQEALAYEWALWGRLDQIPPPGRLWRVWLLLGGRGSGKTRSANEGIRAGVETGERRLIGIVGPTSDAVRQIQVEGPSGLLAVCPPGNKPNFEPSTRRVVWPNGAVARLFSAEEPDRLRGPNFDMLWIDELCSMPNAAAVWDMAQMALRIPGPLGHPPVAIITTTPKPMKLLREIMASPSTVTTRSKTSDNAGNLDASTLAYYHDKYGGTRLGRQELDAEVLPGFRRRAVERQPDRSMSSSARRAACEVHQDCCGC
jgi:phage terminase large subunit-like protein